MKRAIVVTLTLILLMAMILFYYLYELHYPSTRDAQVIFPVSALYPQVEGNIESILVANNEQVKKGDSLLTIDPFNYKIALEKAQATVNDLEQQVAIQRKQLDIDQASLAAYSSKLELEKKAMDRFVEAQKAKVFPQYQADKNLQQLQFAQAEYDKQAAVLEQNKLKIKSQEAKLKTANSELAQAQRNLELTTIKAPEDGFISNLAIARGTYVSPDTLLFGLIHDKPATIRANFLETYIRNIQLGQKVIIRISGYPGKRLYGKVDSLGAGIAPEGWEPHSSLVKVSPTFDWIRLARRFPVDILVTENKDNVPLRMGNNASVEIITRQNQ